VVIAFFGDSSRKYRFGMAVKVKGLFGIGLLELAEPEPNEISRKGAKAQSSQERGPVAVRVLLLLEIVGDARDGGLDGWVCARTARRLTASNPLCSLRLGAFARNIQAGSRRTSTVVDHREAAQPAEEAAPSEDQDGGPLFGEG
jgi:hypothetical protein